MQVTKLHLKNFRCFDDFELDLDQPVTLISGQNGSGKTSLLEALHYGCYLKSFRTNVPLELVSFGKPTFFIELTLREDESKKSGEHKLQIGVSADKRLVKVDQKIIKSYKELASYYRVVTLTEDDIALVKEGPRARRNFIDQALVLFDADNLAELRRYRHIAANRNALLSGERIDNDSHELWTQQLWQQTNFVQKKRHAIVQLLEDSTNQLLEAHFRDYFEKEARVKLSYRAKKDSCLDYAAFKQKHHKLFEQEAVMGRSLFGAHLDEMCIEFRARGARKFASRGQQKLILILLKVALLQSTRQTCDRVAFLLDDFMADFDARIGEILLKLLTKLSVQLIFTSPTHKGQLVRLLIENGARHFFLK